MGKRKAIIEGGKALLKKVGKKAAAGALGIGGALLNTQKAYGGQPTVKDEKKRQALMQDYYDTLGPKKKSKYELWKEKQRL